MARASQGKSRSFRRKSAGILLRPNPKRQWLLRGTALAGGVMAAVFFLPSGEAFAACSPGGGGVSGPIVCNGGDDAVAKTYNATGNFDFELGPDGPGGDPVNDVYNLHVTTLATDAFTLDTAGFAGDFHVYSGSSINADNGTGLVLSSVADIRVTLDGIGSSGTGTNDLVPSFIVGTTGISVNGIAGMFTLDNSGRIEGTSGAAVAVNGPGAIIGNHSYNGMVGQTSGFTFTGQYLDYDNGQGLTAGLTGDGIKVDGVSGAGVPGNLQHAVNIWNGDSGITTGYWDGIDISNLTGTGSQKTDIAIDNSKPDQSGTHGGLIFGQNGQGIDISSTNGSVHIGNHGTVFDAFAVPMGITNLGVYDSAGNSGLLGNDLTEITTWLHGGTVPPGPYLLPTGIIGKTEGIKLNHIGGDDGGAVDIDNSYGFVLGYEGTGIRINDVEGTKQTNDGGDYYAGVWLDNGNGLTAGLDWRGDGLNYRNIDGEVGTNNAGGILLGLDDGAYIRDVWRGNVWFGNNGGIIAGLDNAIDVRGVTSAMIDSTLYGGNAYVENGDFSDSPSGNPYWSTGGGIIIGGSTAISLEKISQQAWIGNGQEGWILGDGSHWHAPVISLNASRNNEEDDPGGAHIQNYGVMSSYDIFGAVDVNFAQLLTDLSTFKVSPTTETADLAPYLKTIFNTNQIFTDIDNLNSYVGSAGAGGDIDNLFKYAEAASDLLVKSDGHHNGLTSIENYNLMVGRVYLDGRDYDWNGNEIENYGTWLTLGRNTLEGSSKDKIVNYGLIQTAFDKYDRDWTSFQHLNDFYNGLGPSESEKIPGFLSMMDGGAGDKTWISGNFHGSTLGDDVMSYVPLDTYFLSDGSGGKSDRLKIGGDVDGSTGLIIKQADVYNGSYLSDNGAIKVISVYGDDLNWNVDQTNTCFEKLCKYGDTFFIASQSQGYIDVGLQGGGTVGAIQTGLDHAWYLTELPRDGGDPPDPDFYLVSGDAPNAVQTAGLTTGAQNIFYSAGGLVEDHVYGLHFPLTGSGGADLPVTEGGGVASGNHKTGLWAKISGNWDDQDTSVDQTISGTGVTIDTGFSQNTYDVLGGADFSPSGEGSGFRFGLYGGYTQSDLSFSSYGASADYKGGVAGAYVAYTSGGWYADTQLNANFLGVDYNAPALGPGVTASANSTSVGVLANTGYRMQNGWGFVEPIASLTYVNTSIDNMTGGNATVDFSNGQSLRAGVGGRIGTSFGAPGGMKTEVSLLAKVWNEFEDANDVTITSGGNSVTFSDNISGVFGEVSATASLYNAARTWSTFVTGGAKFNNDFTSWDAKAGVRTTF